ncbi:glycerol-3-phosphate 1-O-acyltransferase PlsY [Methylophilaceae bacterium]|jgi:acyl phosphate:glycerol-3-phosphate acyltransferase|nr:glycerol-3-phosphate 1-O-acyltransferase PlsY [Methylophilaceae bacterium]
MINQITLVLMAYFFGSLSFGIITSYFFNIADPRTTGSKNPGATNVMRAGNKLAALLTLLGDMLKATLVIAIANYINVSEANLVIISIAVLLGHIFPIYYQFKGGKGVATAFGILLGFNWLLALTVFFVWLCVFLIWRYSSLAAVVAILSAPVVSYFLEFSIETLWLTIIIAILVIYRHKVNIKNLLNGTEPGFR